MPQATKKRKSAKRSWESRKKPQDCDTDAVRSGSSEVVGNGIEIPQPETEIDDYHSECGAGADPYASDSWENLALRWTEPEEEIPMPDDDWDLAASAHGVADCWLEAMEELPLPPLPPLNENFESIWPDLSEHDSFQMENSACWSALANDLTPQSPSITNIEEKSTKLLETGSHSMSSFVSIHPDPPTEILLNCTEVGFTPWSVLANSSFIESQVVSEINQPTSSASMAPSKATVEVADSSTKLGKTNELYDDRLEEPDAIPISPKKKSFGQTLVRSKTMILSIPGKPPEVPTQTNMECYCDACIRCAKEEKVPTPTNRCTDKDDHAEAKMLEIYATFDDTVLSRKSREAPKLARCQSVSADKFAQVAIPKWCDLDGRRIIDYDYFVKWIVMSQAVHSQQCCGVLCPRQEDVKSMRSNLWLMCNVCNVIVKGFSEEPSRGTRLRFCTDWAVLNSGSTYTMAQEMFAFLDIPFMDRKTFFKDELAMDTVLETALQESMDRAIEEEMALARNAQRENQLPDDAPLNLSCELDGSWGLRSNGHRFTSASGCAAIIGTRSKKVVHIATRNKRCAACNRNKKRLKENKPATKHKCFKNYSGPSGGMESDVVIEGFQKLYEKGVKFTTVITDGDSTTVSKLKNECPYGDEIKHQLCCNHILKGVGRKLREIKVPKELKDEWAVQIKRITKGIRSAIKHCSKTNDVEGLRNDIRNVPFHVFYDHTNCRDYFCTHKVKPSIIGDLQKCGAWEKVMVIMEKVAAKAESLIENRTSNLAENLFCRLSKYNVGKRVDTMSRGSYQRRVMITALMCNENHRWHDTYMEIFTGNPPGYWTRKMFAEKLQSLERTRMSQQNPNFTRRSKNIQEKETEYGEEAVEAAEAAENAPREQIVVDVESMRDKYQVQAATKLKLANTITITEMEKLVKGRIMSKSISEILNARETTKWKKCESLLQNTTAYNILKCNRAVVGLVLRVMREEHALEFEESRMFIDLCHSYLCCVPDAVSKDGQIILLVKKKESTGNLTELASSKNGYLGCKLRDGEITVDRNTNIEAQASMHITSSGKCYIYFMLGSNATNYLLKIIDKDETFFCSKIEKKIENFFEDYLLKALVQKQVSVNR